MTYFSNKLKIFNTLKTLCTTDKSSLTRMKKWQNRWERSSKSFFIDFNPVLKRNERVFSLFCLDIYTKRLKEILCNQINFLITNWFTMIQDRRLIVTKSFAFKPNNLLYSLLLLLPRLLYRSLRSFSLTRNYRPVLTSSCWCWHQAVEYRGPTPPKNPKMPDFRFLLKLLNLLKWDSSLKNLKFFMCA